MDEIAANAKDKPYAMLLRWKSTSSSSTLYEDLYHTLCHVRVGLNKVAKEFCCKETTRHIFLQYDYFNWATWKKTGQSNSLLRTNDGNVFYKQNRFEAFSFKSSKIM